jgi:hypothetical protein
MPQRAKALDNQVYYDTYYTLYMTPPVNAYVNWKYGPIFLWAYLYQGSKSMWFNRAAGANAIADASAPVLTGEVLWIEIKYAAINRNLWARGLNDWTVAWDSGSGSKWSLWIVGNSNSGVPISLGDQIYIRCEDPSYQGNYLIQYLPDYPTYLTVGPASSKPRTFQIQSDDAARADESGDPGDRTEELPPDAQSAKP